MMLEKPHHVDYLARAINDCGVPLRFWNNKDGGQLEWTSLTENAYRLLLKNLPDKLLFVISNNTHETVVKLWRDFAQIYKTLNSATEENSDVQVYTLVREWLTSFLDLSEKGGLGYDGVTPYMHCLLYHVPSFVKRLGSHAHFSGQGVEKLNDEIKFVHQKRTKKHNQAVDELATRKRLEYLSSHHTQRDVQLYKKRDIDNWESGKKCQNIE